MFGAGRGPPKPQIRKVTVQHLVTPPPANTIRAANAENKRGNVNRRNGSNATAGASRQNSASNLHPSSASSAHKVSNVASRGASGKARSDSARASPGRGKRKAPSPSTPNFGNASSDEDEDGSNGARKRARHSAEKDDDLKRVMCDEAAFRKRDPDKKEKDARIIQGCDITTGGVFAKGYKPVFDKEQGSERIFEVKLRYPSRYGRERFQILVPHADEDFNPLEDVIQTISHTCKYFFPPSQSEALTDEASGFERRLKRSVKELSFSKFAATVGEFNSLIDKSIADETISSHLRAQHSLALPLVERILAQVYARTVSPHVHLLKAYENGTDDVYGELLPRFTQQIFKDVNLSSDQVFLDLGSGVGNVVLQAALQIGCESWGVERMPNPAQLADKQKKEFGPRCKNWGIKPGPVNLVTGDFLATPKIDAVLRRADVILVNNQAFTPRLNDDLTMKFLDVKEGCKIVSLKPFITDDWKLKERNLQNPKNVLVHLAKKEYWSNSVSWTDEGGTYFIAKKDSTKVQQFHKRLEARRRGSSD
ncbi:Histone-lysine N-methyltransferase [Venturia nashicola]|uniref:Histone-lysine N-methyltransferase, H3 lysine-79 specific n=1 Tax=Venturia nashicola TaxID=86259 RepID=A0A4Z1P4J4_9PEZI|nr:Histone-lysine N-methyltransferase [Venturia nashicola]TLD29682.1 Histone-lysine N-methyltransferase [Venturia nashicola]